MCSHTLQLPRHRSTHGWAASEQVARHCFPAEHKHICLVLGAQQSWDSREHLKGGQVSARLVRTSRECK